MVWRTLIAVSTLAAATVAQVSGVCSGPEMYRAADGHDYRGYINTTISGIPCQKWSAQTPHAHGTTVPDLINGIGDDNYCRNPTGAPYAGCYTTDPSVRFERCDIGLACTAPITQVPNSVEYVPASGEEIIEGGTIALSCLPKPCEMFYTMDGSEPTTRSSRYVRPVAAPGALGPFLLRTLSVFTDGTTQLDRATYVERAKATTTVANLYPPANVVYPKPVLVSVLSASSDAAITIFLQDSTEPQEYVGPFWVYATTRITAVVGDAVLQSTYQVQTSPRLPAFYPTSGTYYGSVRVVFIPTVTREVFYVRVNGGGWELATDMEMTITAVGETIVEVQSLSIDSPASAIESATFTIAPLTPPECFPPSGVYTTAVDVRCTIGNSSVPVQQLCMSTAASTAMECSDVSEVHLATPGTFVLSANYYDSQFNPQLAMFTYTLDPRSLEQPVATPCGGDYMDGLAVAASSSDNVTLTFSSPSAATTRVEQTGATTASVSLVGTTAAPAVYDVALTSHSTMEIAPASPKRCVVALYPHGQDAIPTQWMLVPTVLGASPRIGNLTQTLASALLSTDASIIHTQYLFDRYLLVRAHVHPVLARAYTRRLYVALEALAADVGGAVQTEKGFIPKDEVRDLPLPQIVTSEESTCAATCTPGQGIVIPCNCTGDDVLSSGLVVPTFGIVASFETVTAAPTVASRLSVRLSWLGDVRPVTAKAVIREFGCSDLGNPLEFTDAQTAAFTPRHAREFIVCVDEGNGFHAVPSVKPLVVSTGSVPNAPTLAPCGGTFNTAVTINVSGAIASSQYAINGKEWLPLTSTIRLPMDSFGARTVLSVVSQYVDPLTKVASLSDSKVCVYRFGNPDPLAPAKPMQYSFAVNSALVANSYTHATEGRVQLTATNGGDRPITLTLANGPNCTNPTASAYTQVGAKSAVSDAGFLLEASLNNSEPVIVCASLNADPSVMVKVAPSSMALSPLALLVNASCRDRCGEGQVCIGTSLCGCTAKDGTLTICDQAAEEVTISTDMGTVFLAIAALGLPVGLGMLLFYGARWYNAKGQSPQQQQEQ